MFNDQEFVLFMTSNTEENYWAMNFMSSFTVISI